MKITICGSMKFLDKFYGVKKDLENLGHEVFLPIMDDFGLKGEHGQLKIEHDLIRHHFKLIGNSDAILVLNYDKNNIPNYVGGNSFLEMGKAYDKNIKIYLLNEIPKMLYTDEIIAMQPIILNQDLSKVK